mmetsp:Transcript_23529/g.65457  ORF Transcript_23529/g.65457 Transcript_23529/m.65457 type:complete len:238 (-) Transcript_23529:51-764(-)
MRMRATMMALHQSSSRPYNLVRTCRCLWLLAAAMIPSVATAYRVGDSVDCDIRYDPQSTGAYLPEWGWENTRDDKTTNTLRSQMPKFGIDSIATFQKESEHSGGFTLLFEDALRTVERVPYKNYKGEHLDTMVVTFVYSKSGTGMIHSVWTSSKTYSPHSSSQDPFRVEYVWQEEKPVHLVGGHAILFLIIFITSMLFLFQTCFLDEETEAASMESKTAGRSTTAYGGYNNRHKDKY